MNIAASKRIFVIDDEPTHRILAKEYLEEAGYVVRLAEDGARALKMAKSVRPDLVLIDLMIPSMDGFELCKALKSSDAIADVPIILVTASREPDVILRGLEAGIDDFITKPIDWAFLADRVALVLGLAEQKRRANVEKRELEERLKVSRVHDETAESGGGKPPSPASETTLVDNLDVAGSAESVEAAILAVRQSADAELHALEARYLSMLEAQSQAAEARTLQHANELAECKAKHDAELADSRRAAREKLDEERKANADRISTFDLEKQTAVNAALESVNAESDARARGLEERLAALSLELEETREHHARELSDARSTAEARLRSQYEQMAREMQDMIAAHAAQLSELERRLDEAFVASTSAAERVRADLTTEFETRLRSCWSITQAVAAGQIARLKLLSDKVRSTSCEAGSDAASGSRNAGLLEIERGIGTVSASLGNLRMLAHMMSGKAMLDESSCDLTQIVEDTVLKLKSFAEANRISLSSSVPDEVTRIRADGPRVSYSLVSLTINAIRYSPVGSRVTISVCGGREGPVSIEVRDDGLGIAPAKLAALRNCLDSPSNLLADDKVGFGVPLVAAIARLHDGALELDSSPGRGTVAVLRFPETRRLDQGVGRTPWEVAMAVAT